MSAKVFSLLCFLPMCFVNAQTDDSRIVFSDSALARIDITIGSSALQWIYNNVKSDSEHAASFRFRSGTIDETVDSVGFRLRGNTSRDSRKKSFKVSFNSFVKGKNFHGIEKLNLNGEHNDPSIIRSKLSFDLYRDMGIPASRASHAAVYINGMLYGLYISVEHVDEEFLKKNFDDDSGNLWKCLYPADLKYLGSDPNLYSAVMNGQTPAYELSTNEAAGDFTGFARLVSVINNTPSNAFADSIEKVLDVRRVLQYFSVNTLVGSWDDYRSLMNNYYLYHIPSEDRFTVIPYDYDNTFGVDWFNKDWASADPYNYPKAASGSRPMWEKIIANNQYRDLYTHFLRFYRDSVYSLPLWEDRLVRLKNMITTAAAEDSFRTLDYGFTFTDFMNSYSSVPYKKLHVKRGLREFVNTRNTSIDGQLHFTNASPIIYHNSIVPKYPSAADSIRLEASCFASAGIKEVTALFTPDGSSSPEEIPMIHAPVYGTKQVELSDRWTGVIAPPGGSSSGTVRYLIKDSLDQMQYYPRTGSIRISVPADPVQSVRINEFMADNTTIADPAGQWDDWVELYNPTSQPVVLTNKYLTDKPASLTKWKFTQPDLVIQPGEYLIVWCDEEPGQPGVHAGIKLSAGGEFIGLTDSDGVTVLDSITFGAQTANISFGRHPDGSATWGPMSPTPLAVNSIILHAGRAEQYPARFDVAVYPNPFNPSTTIRYGLPADADVAIDIADIMGRSVWRRAMHRQYAGTHTVQWNGRTNDGVPVSTGMYFLRVAANGNVLTKKLMLLK